MDNCKHRLCVTKLKRGVVEIKTDRNSNNNNKQSSNLHTRVQNTRLVLQDSHSSRHKIKTTILLSVCNTNDPNVY